MTWVLLIGGTWLALATGSALLIARAIRIADQRERTAPRPGAALQPIPLPPGAGESRRPPVRRGGAAPAIPQPRSGNRRLARQRTHATAVRRPLRAAERVPPTPSGAA